MNSLKPGTDDLARALREGAPNRDIATLIRGEEPVKDPVLFSLNSGPILVRSSDDKKERTVFGTTSSTSKDLYDTRFVKRALTSMLRDCQSHLTFFLNHDYTIPESIFGSCVDAKLVSRTAPDSVRYTDLDVEVQVVDENVNPRAVRCYTAIKDKGVKLGFSIGAMITDWEWQFLDGKKATYDDAMKDPEGVIFSITDCLLVESSLVGVPANRRSWIQDARRSLRRAGAFDAPTARQFPIERILLVNKPLDEVQADVSNASHPDTQDTTILTTERDDATQAGTDTVPSDAFRDAVGLVDNDLDLAHLDATFNGATGITSDRDSSPAQRNAVSDDAPDAPSNAVHSLGKAERKAAKKAAKSAQRQAGAVVTPAPSPEAPKAPDSDLSAFLAEARSLKDTLERSISDLQARQVDLEKNNKKLQKSAKRAAQVLADADATGLYRPTNRAASKTPDITPEELVAMSDDEFFEAAATNRV